MPLAGFSTANNLTGAAPTCLNTYGDQDASGIGVPHLLSGLTEIRLSVYISTLQAFIFYIISDQSSVKTSMLQLTFTLFTLHIITFLYMFIGLLDTYSIFILIHQLMLVNAVHLIYFFSETRSPYRLFFTFNTAFLTIEFFLVLGGHFVSRSLNLCPELQNALDSTQAERLHVTLMPFIGSCFLAVADFIIGVIDMFRNKGKEEKHFSKHVLPKWMRWNSDPKKGWSITRITVCLIGVLYWLFSVFTLEFLVIWKFNHYASNFPDLSSQVDSWSFGQPTTTIIATLGFGYSLRTYLLPILSKYDHPNGILFVCRA
jgi:hypothetical protein